MLLKAITTDNLAILSYTNQNFLQTNIKKFVSNPKRQWKLQLSPKPVKNLQDLTENLTPFRKRSKSQYYPKKCQG